MEDLTSLLKALRSRKRSVRQKAVESVLKLPPEELVALVQADNRIVQRHRWWMGSAIGVYSLFFVLFVFWLMNVGRTDPSRVLSPEGVRWLVSGMFLPVLLLFTVPTRSRQSLSAALNATENVEYLPAILTLLSIDGYSGGIKRLAVFPRLLPRLSLEQAHRLTAEQRSSLVAPLVRFAELIETPGMGSYTVDLVKTCLCVLKVLEQIGGEKELPIVRKVAHHTFKNATGQAVGKVAQECLPYLELRANEANQMQTLLRASDSASLVTPDTLLRPAAGAPDTTTAQDLLRPTSRD